jgi:hypothetical protein
VGISEGPKEDESVSEDLEITDKASRLKKFCYLSTPAILSFFVIQAVD